MKCVHTIDQGWGWLGLHWASCMEPFYVFFFSCAFFNVLSLQLLQLFWRILQRCLAGSGWRLHFYFGVNLSFNIEEMPQHTVAVVDHAFLNTSLQQRLYFKGHGLSRAVHPKASWAYLLSRLIKWYKLHFCCNKSFVREIKFYCTLLVYALWLCRAVASEHYLFV